MPVLLPATTRRALTVLVAAAASMQAAGDLRAAPLPPGPAPAQQRPAAPEQRPVFGAEVGVGTISVGAVDASGEPLEGLTGADFYVEEDGREREVAFVSAGADAPLDVALILDLSGSMAGGSWRQQTLDFLATLSAQRDCVLLLRFSHTVSTSIWGRPDDAALAAAIEGSHTEGATSLYDALVAGIQQLSPRAADIGVGRTGALARAEAAPAGPYRGCPATTSPTLGDPLSHRRTAVVAVTDGEDSSSGHNMHQVELVADATGVPIYQIEVAAAGRSTVTMRRSAPQLATADMGVGVQPRGGFGDNRESLRDFQKLVSSSAGDTFRAGPEAYEQLLDRLRGFYLVGYRIAETDARATSFEYARHEVTVELRNRRGTTVHRPFVYRPTFDSIRAASELAEGLARLQSQHLEAALEAFGRSVAADPNFAPPHTYMANILLWSDGVESALTSALRAAALDPANADYQLLVSDLAMIAERYELAWEHAIRGAQAGADATDVFEALALSSALPAGFPERLDDPRLVVIPAAPSQPDLIARAAVPKAIRSVQTALQTSARVAVVPDPRHSEYIVWLLERDLSDGTPRRLRGTVLLADRTGETLYEGDFSLNDLDDSAQNSIDLAEHIEKIVDKVAAPVR